MFDQSTIVTVGRILAAVPGAKEEEVSFVLDAMRRGPRSRAARVRAGEAATMLGISRATFFRALRQGRWRPTRIYENRKSVFYLRAEIERLAEARTAARGAVEIGGGGS